MNQNKTIPMINLRAIEPEDVDFLYECEADRENSKWSDYRAPFSKNQLLTYALSYNAEPFSTGELRLLIETDEKKMVGILDLYGLSEKDSKAYLGICIHPLQRRQGYAEEAIKAVKDYAKERLGLKQLIVKVSTSNSPGRQLFGKCGFKEIAVLPSWHRIGQDFHDFHLMTAEL